MLRPISRYYGTLIRLFPVNAIKHSQSATNAGEGTNYCVYKYKQESIVDVVGLVMEMVEESE